MDFVVFPQGIATFFEDILSFRAQDCIVTLLFLERTCFYIFKRLNKKTNVVWDLSIVAQIYSFFSRGFVLQRFYYLLVDLRISLRGCILLFFWKYICLLSGRTHFCSFRNVHSYCTWFGKAIVVWDRFGRHVSSRRGFVCM